MAELVGAVIPAAGAGRRLASRSAKAFVPLAGKPLVVHTLQAFQASPAVRWIVVVTQAADRGRLQQLVQRHRLTKVRAIVPGGPSRSESVVRGIAALPPQVRWVLVHDGARPCVTPRLIAQAITKAKRHGAIACGLPASLTVKAVDHEGSVRLTLDREQLWMMQTPQVFRRDWITQALEQAAQQSNPTTNGSPRRVQFSRLGEWLRQFPDDAALLEWAGFPVRVIPGDSLNIKVTTLEDVWIAEAVLRRGRGSHGRAVR